MIKIFCLSLSIFSGMAWTNCDQTERLDWLLGVWQTRDSETVISEQWSKVSAYTYEGTSLTRRNGQQVVQESMRLVMLTEQWFYLAKVSHNPLPVAFKLIHCTDTELQFENNRHDFPNRIIYRRLSGQQMQVDISSNNHKGFSLHFYKQN